MAANRIEIHITAENEQFVNKMQEIIRTMDKAKRSSDSSGQAVEGFGSKLAKVGMVTTGLYAGLSMLKTALDGSVGALMKYNMNMENSSAAFEVFLGNTQLATQYTNDLKKIAADTPFDLPGVMDAGKKLLAFGFDAETALKMLRTIGDASAGLGLSTEGLNRITLALGQIKAKGRVMGDELLQLTEAGVPAQQILAEKLHLTADEVKNIGDAGIDADTAIKALTEGMDERFGGMAQKLSDKMAGLLSTIEDNVMNTGGFILDPLFQSLEHGLTKVRDFSDQLTQAINGQGNIDENAGVLKTIVRVQTGIERATDLFVKFTEQFGAYDDDGKFYFSEEALASFEKAGNYLDKAWGLVLDIGDAMVSLEPIAAEILGRFGQWFGALVNIADWLINKVKGGADAANESFGNTKVIIDLIVDAMIGMFVIEKVITMAKALQATFILVKGAIVEMRKAIQTASVAQAVLNTLTNAMGGPAGLAMAAAGTAAAIGAGYLIEKSFDKVDESTGSNDSKVEENYQKLMSELKKNQNNRAQYQPAKPNPIQQGDDKAAKQRLKALQSGLNRALKILKANLDAQLEAQKQHMEDVELLYKQNQMSVDAYYDEKVNNDVFEAKKKLESLQRQYDSVLNTPVADDKQDDKADKLREIEQQMAKQTDSLKRATDALEEVANIQSVFTAEQARKAQPAGGDGAGIPQGSTPEEGALYLAYQTLKNLDTTGKLTYDVLLGMAQRESSGHHWADNGSVLTSGDGGIGLMQLTSDYAQGLAGNPYDLQSNANGGTKYLIELLNQYGSLKDALYHYNGSGPAAERYSEEVLKQIADKVDRATELLNAPLVKIAQNTAGYTLPAEYSYHGLDNRVIDVNSTNEKQTNVSDIQDSVKNALNALAKEFLEQTGKKLMLTGGAEKGYHATGKWGHEGGWKADIVNVGEYEELFAQLAAKNGFAVGNEGDHYDLSGGKGSVGGKQITASAQGTINNMVQSLDDTVARSAVAYEKLKQLRNDQKAWNENLQKQAELYGGGYTESKNLKIAEYKNKIDEVLNKYPGEIGEKRAAVLEQLLKEELNQIDIKQYTAGLDFAVKDLEESGYQMGAKIVAGIENTSDAVERYYQHFFGDTSPIKQTLDNLITLAAQYQRAGNLKAYWDIREKIEKVQKSFTDIVESWIKDIQDKFSWRSQMIDVDPYATELQKSNAKEAFEKSQYSLIASAQRMELSNYIKQLAQSKKDLEKLQLDFVNAADDENKNRIQSAIALKTSEINKLENITIPELKRQSELNASLATTINMLDKVHIKSKQALEDGLVTFLTDGINEAESLADALNDLLVSVLKSIQKVFAEQITSDLMNSWFPRKDNTKTSQQESAEDMSFGYSGNLTEAFGQATNTTNNFLSSFSTQAETFVGNLQNFTSNILSIMNQANSTVSDASLDNGFDMSFGLGSLSSVAVQHHADGGKISGPGTGTSDSILSWLSNGEFVIKADMVKKYGRETLERINNGTFNNLRVRMPKFARGGLVGAYGNGTMRGMENFAAMIGTEVNPNIRVNNYVDGKKVFDEYGASIVKSVARKEITSNAKLYSELFKKRR